MSRSINKATLMGRVGAEPEIRTTQSGTKIAKLSIATGRKWTNKQTGAVSEETQWHRITFWDRMAEIVEQYVHKGDRIYIEGRIEYSKATDQHGVERYYTDIVGQEMIMLGGAGEREAAPATQRSAPAPFDDSDDSLPF